MKDPHPVPLAVEAASLAAWPALEEEWLDGWLLRYTRGFTKRANSVVPLRAGPSDIEEAVTDCEGRYRVRGLTPIFRLTDLADHHDLERHLETRGYRRADPTRVMAMALPSAIARKGDPEATVALERAAWLSHYDCITSTPASTRALHGALLQGIRSAHTYRVRIAPDRTPVSCGFAVCDGALLGLFDIATVASARRAGHARAVVQSLLAWGTQQGAAYAYLQVVESNAIAIALYEQFGFTPLYRYWYRIAPARPAESGAA